jgi:tight adherence protein C
VLSTTALIAIVAPAGALALLGWAAMARPNPAHVQIRANLAHGLQPVDGAGPQAGRATAIARIPRLLTPAFLLKRLERSLALAGRPPAWPIQRLLTAKIVLGILGTSLGLLWMSAHPGAVNNLLAIAVAGVSYFLPDLLLSSEGQKRQTALGLELADTLDQMSIAVAAGLAFESAMMRSAKNGKGPLAEELTRTLQDMRFGLSRREAYLALAARTNVPDLRRFLRAVIQADAYGVAITDVLKTQAAEMRLKRRQRAETKAMQIPVKVIFPLMLCILPVLFIVLLGPAILNVLHTFSSR